MIVRLVVVFMLCDLHESSRAWCGGSIGEHRLLTSSGMGQQRSRTPVVSAGADWSDLSARLFVGLLSAGLKT